jgi:small GTP-binding protein
MPPELKTVKLVLVGDQAVGKTSIATRHVEHEFDPDVPPTVNTTYSALDMGLHGTTYAFDLWDTAGQEQFKSMVPNYARNAAGALLVFDVTNADSFANLPEWVSTVRQTAEPAFVIFGNKTDLEGERAVPAEQAENYCRENGFAYCEGSAKTGVGVRAAFEMLAERAVATDPGVEVRHEVPIGRTDVDRRCC